MHNNPQSTRRYVISNVIVMNKAEHVPFNKFFFKLDQTTCFFFFFIEIRRISLVDDL